MKELFEGEHFFRDLINRAMPAVQRLWAKIWPSAKEPRVLIENIFNRAGLSELTPEESVRMQAHLDTITDFQPRRRPLDVVLIRCNHDPFEGPFELDLCWGQAITGSTQIEVGPLRHLDFLDRKHIDGVAEIMKTHLKSRVDA